MKNLISCLVFCLILIFSTLSSAAQIAYCPGTQTSQIEDNVIQKLVAKFAEKMQCNIGKNCLLKWSASDKTEKFSIAWQEQCGPIINGVYQLGDEGHGSTFVCEFKNNKSSVCCWPLGYDYAKEFVICSDNSQNSHG